MVPSAVGGIKRPTSRGKAMADRVPSNQLGCAEGHACRTLGSHLYTGRSTRTVASNALRPIASMASAVVPWNRAKAWTARLGIVSGP